MGKNLDHIKAAFTHLSPERLRNQEKRPWLLGVFWGCCAGGPTFNFFPESITPELIKYLSTAIAWLIGYSISLSFSANRVFNFRSFQSGIQIRNEADRIARDTARNISKSLERQEDGTYAIGHYLCEKGNASPLSTAYAVRAILANPSAFEGYVPIKQALEYLLNSKQGVGWHAASQNEPRPEVSAGVLSAIRLVSGDSADYSTGITELVNLAAEDPAFNSLTFVATSVLEELPPTGAAKNTRDEATNAIQNGFVTIDENRGYWCSTLTAAKNNATPSPAATARCLLALRTCEPTQAIEKNCQFAVNWLNTLPEFQNETDQLVRQLSSNQTEVLVPRHFTSALVLLASCRWKELGNSEELAEKALQFVLEQHGDGWWRWDDGKSPVWMNEQGIVSVGSYLGAKAEWELNR